MTRYLFLFIIVLTGLGAGVYAYLGGFRQPVVQLETMGQPVFLAGQAFRGPANDEQFGTLFRRAKEVQESQQLKGELANLYLNSPEKAHDTINAFIGLSVGDTSQALPAGFRYRFVPAGQRVMRARLTGVSYLLAPNKLYPAALEAVKAQKLKERNFYLERFGPGEDADLWVGVQ
jgi:hypothetical protein